jgi:hypothetical protein
MGTTVPIVSSDAAARRRRDLFIEAISVALEVWGIMSAKSGQRHRMPAMRDPAGYSVKDGISVMAFSAGLLTMAWLTMFFLTPESISCARIAGSPQCRLTRAVFGVRVRDRRTGTIQAVSLEESRTPAQSTQRRGGTNSWIRYHTESGPMDGSSVSSREDSERIVAGLQRFLAEPSSPQFDATPPGTSIVPRVMPWIFLLGMVGVVNGIATVVKARRRAR